MFFFEETKWLKSLDFGGLKGGLEDKNLNLKKKGFLWGNLRKNLGNF